MSLPPGFLDELRTRVSLSQVVGRKVTWDQRKSNQGKGDLWAPCPFHHEKTASFHVDDKKGFYYCFGCQAKGDALGFIKETENVSFMEAVEILAAEAGMPMPARDPRAKEQADRRTQLIEVVEAATRFFRMALQSNAGGEARAYLARRGMPANLLDQFEIGFAPAGWDNLREALKAQGISVQMMLDCGLVKASDKGREPYDVFRNRIMFPIRDARGRAIAFGGRAMDPNDNAKYLNSPETELFDKSRNLYNFKGAREASGKGQTLIVGEGYMDVIALTEAGFGASVAPLGTAVTESQLQLMWRVSDEPVIALDGDKAGLRAAYRVIDLALPLLEAGKSLRFALMPEGEDPDSLLRAKGSEAVAQVLRDAIPTVDLLWRQETEGKVLDSPERKAALDKSLRERILKIQDPSLRRHYGEAIKDLRWKAFRPQGGFKKKTKGGFRQRRAGGPEYLYDDVRPETRQSPILEMKSAETVCEVMILAMCLRKPHLFDEFESRLMLLEGLNEDHGVVLNAIIASQTARDEDFIVHVAEIAGPARVESVLSHPHVKASVALRPGADPELGPAVLQEQLDKLSSMRGHMEELDEALNDIYDTSSEAVTWRLAQSAQARNAAGKANMEASTEFDVGDNGALMDKEERTAFDDLVSAIRFDKSKKG